MNEKLAEMYRESQRKLYAENQELIAALRGLVGVVAAVCYPEFAAIETRKARELLARIDGKGPTE